MEASTNSTPISASCTSGRLRSVQVSSSAPSSAAATAAICVIQPVSSRPGRVRRDHAERRDLRDREIDEHDAAPQHLLAERHVRQRDEDAGDERRPQDAEGAGEVVHLPAASSRLMVSSKSPNRSLASGVPPTENGSTTTGTPIFCDSQSAAFGSL